jgi:ABC-type oligopeptide transport system ATPase subunit
VFAVRGARVSDYGGKSLNAGHEHSQVFINPEHKRTRELLQWAKKRDPANINSVSNANMPGMANSNSGYERPDNFRLI